ncbi:MAG TPA: hypothetical protein VJN68_00110 [Burkholderiaceae bacterium]|nr:hypothetical protein [Burkholderiaceae bacterium]
MKTTLTAMAVALSWAASAPAGAADDALLQRMVLCQDSWLDWKSDRARLARYVDEVESRFSPGSRDPAFTPKAPIKAFGLPVARLFPQNVGMALGVSVIVDADFAQARRSLEGQLGRTMKCESSDGERACELKIGEKKTVVLMSEDDGKAKQTLLGCYYYYEK